MWYKIIYAQIDQNLIQQWQNRIQAANSIEDIEERNDALNDLILEYYNTIGVNNSEYKEYIYEPLHQAFYSTLSPAIEASKNRRAKERELTGEPELVLHDIYSYPEWIEWKEKTSGPLSNYDLPYLISGLEEAYSIYAGRIFSNPPSYSGIKRKEITDPQEIQFIRQMQENLQNRAFQTFGIDKTQLQDPELWGVEPIGDYEKELKLVKRIDWLPNNDPDAEGTIVTFSISPTGIGIMAEVADPMPVALQREELQKFMSDIEKFVPQDWSREIKYIEGGDFEDIMSGKLGKNIKVYRMMSDEEYEKWQRGEVIPPGKYFALKRHFAVGTDFADEGFKEVFTFIVNRSLMTGMDENVLISDVPLHLEGNRLTPA